MKASTTIQRPLEVVLAEQWLAMVEAVAAGGTATTAAKSALNPKVRSHHFGPGVPAA